MDTIWRSKSGCHSAMTQSQNHTQASKWSAQDHLAASVDLMPTSRIPEASVAPVSAGTCCRFQSSPECPNRWATGAA